MKAIIFDMDGLMVDSERLYLQCERKMVNELGKVVKEETLWNLMGRKPLEAMTVLKEDLNLQLSAEELLDMRDSLLEKKLREELEPMPGLMEIITGFKGRMRLAIATGSPRRFLDIVMERLNIREYFDTIQTADEIINGKPDPEIYLKTAGKLGLRPEECLVLEDSSNGAMAGKRAGCYTIAIPSEFTRQQDFTFVDHVAKDLHRAKEHILNMQV